MKRYLLFLITAVALSSCTKFNFEDTGKAEEYYDVTIKELMQKDSYNWDSTLLVIKRAGLDHIFDGTDEEYTDITFFGPTNHTIRRWMYTKVEEFDFFTFQTKLIKPEYHKIEDIPVEDCKKLILSHVLKESVFFEDVPRGRETFNDETYETIIEGGMNLELEAGNKAWIGKFEKIGTTIAGTGPMHITLIRDNQRGKNYSIGIASSNIKTKTGVIHSLSYKAYFNDMTDDVK